MLAFSTTDRASFDALPGWRSKVLEQCPGIAMVLVQNKVDLIDKVRACATHSGVVHRHHVYGTACWAEVHSGAPTGRMCWWSTSGACLIA